MIVLLIASNIDAFLDVLRRWLEESRSINVAAEEYGAANTAATRRLHTTRPQEP